MKRNKYQPKWIFSGLLLAALLTTGCDIGVMDPGDDEGSSTPSTNNSAPTTNEANNETNTGAEPAVTDTPTTAAPTNTTPVAPPPTDGNYALSLSNQTVNLTEGSNVSVTVQIQRNNGYTGQINLGAEVPPNSNAAELSWTFTNTRIAENENSTSITLALDYAVLPILPQTRTLRIRATDGTTQRNADLTINVTPTDKADVYLLIGQSNMVGFSEDNAKEEFPGGADAPVDGILQLNPTGNDEQNFPTEASFINQDSIAVQSPRFTLAIDPLHHGFDSSINGKASALIGPGLSFAKRARQNTNAPNIYLVPAAWADTGFCRRARSPALQQFEGELGWNATSLPNDNIELSGTLLHDRALARVNLTLDDTKGILRGILWHQGEADSDSAFCAGAYEQNIVQLVESLRTNIIVDARGSNARGPNANVPFIVGTMSKGGDVQIFSETKSTVDSVHRRIKEIVPFSAVVENDDLVPSNGYPCGDGGCIHFGSLAYREMGSRYYDQLIQAAIGE